MTTTAICLMHITIFYNPLTDSYFLLDLQKPAAVIMNFAKWTKFFLIAFATAFIMMLAYTYFLDKRKCKTAH